MVVKNNGVEVFDRVKISDDCALEFIRGKSGTVAYMGSSGVSIVIEDISDPIPVLWSEFEPMSWDEYGEEE